MMLLSGAIPSRNFQGRFKNNLRTIIMSRKKTISEVVDINGSKVFVENGEVQTVLSEEIQRTGWMTIEEAMMLTENKIRKVYEMNGKL